MAFLKPALVISVSLLLPAADTGPGATESLLPVGVQAPLIAKMLTYDRALPQRAGDTIHFAVVFQQDFPESRELALDLLRTFAHPAFANIGNLPVVFHKIMYEDSEQLRAELREHGVHIIYLAPLRAADPALLIRSARFAGAATVTPLRAYVREGAALGVILREGRPHLLVNMKAARLQGMDLSAQLLKLAEIIES